MMKSLKRITALVLALALGVLVPLGVSASSVTVYGLNEQSVRILDALRAVEPELSVDNFSFVNQTERVMLEHNVRPTQEEADYVIAIIGQAERVLGALVADPSNNVLQGQLLQLLRRAVAVFCLELIVTGEFPHSHGRMWVQKGCCTSDCSTDTPVTPGTPGGPGAPGTGTGTPGTPPGVDARPPIRPTGLNASTGLLVMLGLTGLAGGAGVVAKSKD